MKKTKKNEIDVFRIDIRKDGKYRIYDIQKKKFITEWRYLAYGNTEVSASFEWDGYGYE